MASPSSFDEGMIRPDLIRQLRSILDQYPDNGQMLKELIQNAEDAGATEITFLHDRRSYCEDSLCTEDLAQFQGPSLLAHNDAVFSDQDWLGIRKLSDSVKEKDPTKVGRFGLGFKSVFHMTDLPAILSGEYLGFLDPHEIHFEREIKGSKVRRREKTSSYIVHLKDKTRVQSLKNQLEPFCHKLFGLKFSDILEKGYYKGTILRFPLRTPQMKSDLSDTIYTEEKLDALFEAMENDCHLNLLFLRHLECLRFYKQEQDGPKLCFDVEMDIHMSPDARPSRKQMITEIDKYNSHPEEIVSAYSMTLAAHGYHDDQETTNKHTYHVCQYIGKSDEDVRNMKYLPFVGVAMNEKHDNQTNGRIFCFLPLPAIQDSRTGLDFHVNGFFAVDQNRQHLKMPSADQSHLEDADQSWNQFLVKVLLPKAISYLAEHVTKSKDQTEAWKLVQSMIPDPNKVEEYWSQITEPVCEILKEKPVFWTKVLGGRWVKWSEALFWNIHETCNDQASRVLLEDKYSLVKPSCVTNFVGTFIASHCQEPNYVTPEVVASALRNVQKFIKFSQEDRLSLLSYVVESDELNGIQLLPLMDGTFAEFDVQGRKLYLDQDNKIQKILPRLKHKILDTRCLTKETMKRLTDLTRQGQYQLHEFSTEDFIPLLKEMMADVQAAPYENMPQELNDSWLESLWTYIVQHNVSPRLLDGLRLIPASDSQWLTISTSTPRMVCSHSHLGVLPVDIVDFLELLSIPTINVLPEPIEQCHLLFEEKILYRPIARDVLLIMQHYMGKSRQNFLESFSQVPLEMLMKWNNYMLTHCNEFDGLQDILMVLPMFQTCQEHARVSAFSVPNAALACDVVVPLQKQLIDGTDDTTKRLLQFLRVPFLRAEEVLKEFILPTLQQYPEYYNRQQVGIIEQHILGLVSSDTINKAQVLGMLQTIPFVKNRIGQLCTPCSLYDPHDNCLTQLLPPEKLPGECASHPRFTDALKSLGVKSRQQLFTEDIECMAKSVSCSTSIKAELFCHMMNDHVSHVVNDGLMFRLSTIAWVPVATSQQVSAAGDIPFKNDLLPRGLARPTDVVSEEHSLLVGSVCPVVSKSKYPALYECYKWGDLPSASDILLHLKNIATKSSDVHLYYSAIKAINDVLCKTSPVEIRKVLKDISFEEWVFHGNGFCACLRMVLNTLGLDLEPYLYQLPRNLTQHQDMFLSLGAQMSVNHMAVLEEIGFHHSQQTETTHERTKRDRTMVISILDAMRDSGVELNEDLLVPIKTSDGSLKLAEKHNCTSADVSTLDSILLQDGDSHEDVLFVHEDLPRQLVSWLELPSLLSRILDTDDLDVAYGQEEPLTRRLKSLLDDYPDGLSVIKELIQNADDAGATEIRFLYDERLNGDFRTNLLDGNMADLQGPALWAFNDALFSEDDFKNIVKLGGATKADKPDKIGRFGLGFNAVYNLTDVPSFVSGKKVVFFDPHFKYLGKALKDKSKPGIMLDIVKNRSMLKHFRNQFHPFNGVYDCDLTLNEDETQQYNGTLFRLPLRNASLAFSSEISDKPYTRAEVLKLFYMLAETSESILLFTQNVKKITVDHLHHDSVDPTHYEPWLTVEKTKGITSIRSFEQNACILSAANNSLRHSTEIENDACSEIIKVDIKYGRIPGEKHFQDLSCFWYVGSAVGKEKSRLLAESNPSLLPVASVAAKMTPQAGGYVPAPLSGYSSVFCFLPLPQTTNLPVHVNGYFAVTSNRKSIHVKDIHDAQNKGAAWNQALIEDALALAYVNFLSDLSHCVGNPMPVFNMWPTKSPQETCDLSAWLVSAVFKHICTSSGLCVFPSGSQWVDCSQMVTLDRKDVASVDDKTIAFMLKVFADIYNRNGQGVFVVDIPLRVQEILLSHLPDKNRQSQVFGKERFYTEVFLPHVTQVDEADRDHLILYALCDIDNTIIHQSFQELKCIPVQPDGSSFAVGSQLVCPESKLTVLYKSTDAVFPKLRTKNEQERSRAMVKLRCLGMASKELSWDQIVNRCDNTTKLKTRELKLKRIQLLLKLMNDNLRKGREPSLSVKEQLRDAKLIPVKQYKASGLPWKSKEFKHAFLSANDLFSEDKEHLVGLVKPIADPTFLDITSRNTHTAEFLGLSTKAVGPENVLGQMKCVSKIPVDGSNMRGIVDVCSAVYQFFSGPSSIRPDILQELKNIPSIFCGSQFAIPTLCALDFPAGDGCQPHLFTPLANFRQSNCEFLCAVGVKEQFQAIDFLKALQRIHAHHKEEALMAEEFAQTVRIVGYLGGAVALRVDVRKWAEEHGGLYLPSTSRLMTNSKDLCYNNCHWIRVDDADAKVCASEISHILAERLGVKTIRKEILKSHTMGIAFGQKESLSNRINRILSGYPFDCGILKELLQNADDAGATELHFILDPRQHSSKHVFEDSWEPLQGPSLCVFNNKPFTKEDLVGIQKLGEGSKSRDTCKTGQYGVGFNCVYHITDTPTFVSNVPELGLVLCAFDPNCRYVPDADEAEPGRMYTMDDGLQNRFDDVLKPYKVGQFDIDSGTMFRLPLRTTKQAHVSGIKAGAVTVEAVRDLFLEFQRELSDILLFVNSVRKITLNEVDSEGVLKQISYVESTMSAADLAKREKFSKEVKSAAHALRNGQLRFAERNQAVYTLNVTSENNSQSWQVAQRFGYDQPDAIDERLIRGYKKEEMALLPRAGVARPLHTEKDVKHKLFCFLPLPVKTSLPVHVNGHFALDYETRRNLWQGDNDLKTLWNSHIMTLIVVPVYIELILSSQNDINEESELEENYFSLFPELEKNDGLQKELCTSLLQELGKKNHLIMPVSDKNSPGLRWLPVSGDDSATGYFNDVHTQIQNNKTKFKPLPKSGRDEDMSLSTNKSKNSVPKPCSGPEAQNECFFCLDL